MRRRTSPAEYSNISDDRRGGAVTEVDALLGMGARAYLVPRYGVRDGYERCTG